MPSPSTPQTLTEPAHSKSYGGGLMSAALVALLLAILFIALLHFYAKLFLTHSPPPSRNNITTDQQASSSLSLLLAHARFLRPTDTNNYPTNNGLDSSVIAKIPLFVYEPDQEEKEKQELMECVICLSAFQGGEIGRNLRNCGHGFHVECIDMWLRSHSSCPTCRAPASGIHRGGGEVNCSESSNDVVGSSGDSDSVLLRVSDVVVEVPSGGGDVAAAGLGGSLKRMLSWSVSGKKSRSLSSGFVNESENRERSIIIDGVT